MTTSPPGTPGYPGPATSASQQDRTDADPKPSSAPSLAGVRVRRVAGHLGAEIDGVSLGDVSDPVLAGLQAALLEHQVLFVRDQDLDHAGHVAFAWGPPWTRPAAAATGGAAQPVAVSNGWFRNCTSAVPCTAEADETTVSTASSWNPRRVVAPQLIIVAFSFDTVTATVSARLPTKGTRPSTPSGRRCRPRAGRSGRCSGRAWTPRPSTPSTPARRR